MNFCCNSCSILFAVAVAFCSNTAVFLLLQVIKNGQMLGVHERRNRNTISTGSMASATAKQQQAALSQQEAADAGSGMAVIGEVDLLRLFNDGGK